MNPLRLGYLNLVQLTGRLVADPELRYTQKGAPVCSFRIACSRRYKNRDTGEFQEETLFVNVVAWRRQAELVNDYLKKGSAILIEGRLQSRQWESNKGEKRSTIEVVVRRIQFLDMPTKTTGTDEDTQSKTIGTDEDTQSDIEDETKGASEVDTPF